MELLTQAMEGTGEDGPSNRSSRANRLANDVRLPPDCLDRFPSQLSGGQKQRVNIGRALCVMPKLIVADEIVSGLDVSVQAHVLNLLLEMNREHGITVVFISHDLAVVRYLCNRVFLMNRGEIVESGNAEDVFSCPQHPYTRMLIDAAPPESVGVKWPSVSLATM
jgi:peptide/nickel transport system ATP-binding protein